MARVIKLTEKDLTNIVNKVLSEQYNWMTAGTPPTIDTKTPQPKAPAPQQKVNINPKNLKKGDGGRLHPEQVKDVSDLQQKLIDLGLLKTKSGKPTGYFGDLTQKALDTYNATGVPTPGVQPKVKEVQKSKAAQNAAECETGTDKVLIPGASLLFDGDKLTWLVDGKALKSWDATSGLTWKNTPMKDWGKLLSRYTQNRNEWSKQKDAGPLPEGQYKVGPLETRGGQPEEIGALEAFWYKLTGQAEAETPENKKFCKNTILSRISWGNYRLRITPIGNQKMYDRGDFYVHGGSLAGSHGCIDLTNNMDDFAKFFGVWSSANKKKTIPMVVKYKNPAINQVIQKLTNLS